tara:strand:- start:9 stop:752 length:744 start_codon:yes stop_codon:yes gene_type:complete
MLIDRITDLSGPLPETLTDPTYIYEVAAREVLDIVEDSTFIRRRSRRFDLNASNLTFNTEGKKIVNVIRHDANDERNIIECEEIDFTEAPDYKPGSGSLNEATSYSPVYSVLPTKVDDGALNIVSGELTVYPEPTNGSVASIYYIEYPTFGASGDLNVTSMEDLIHATDNTRFDYWTEDMEEGFIVRSAMRILQVRLSEVVTEEEDTELSQLIQTALASVTAEWERLKSVLKDFNPEDQAQLESMRR